MAEVADDFEDEMDEVQDLEDVDEEIDGEDLFGDNMMKYILIIHELMLGITENEQKKIFMTWKISMTRISMTTLISRRVAKSKPN
jgi:hypothetical protein